MYICLILTFWRLPPSSFTSSNFCFINRTHALSHTHTHTHTHYNNTHFFSPSSFFGLVQKTHLHSFQSQVTSIFGLTRKEGAPTIINFFIYCRSACACARVCVRVCVCFWLPDDPNTHIVNDMK